MLADDDPHLGPFDEQPEGSLRLTLHPHRRRHRHRLQDLIQQIAGESGAVDRFPFLRRSRRRITAGRERQLSLIRHVLRRRAFARRGSLREY